MWNEPNASARLREAVNVGMVQIVNGTKAKRAIVCAPPDVSAMSDDDWLNVIAAGSEMARELRALGYAIVGDSEPATERHPGEFSTFCDRCKNYKEDCLRVPYTVPPSLTPPEVEPVIGPDCIDFRVVIDPEDIRMKHVAMCAECRAAKILFAERAYGY